MSSWGHRDKQIVVAREGERLFLSCNVSDSAIGFKALILQNNVFTIRIVVTEVAGANVRKGFLGLSERNWYYWYCRSAYSQIMERLSIRSFHLLKYMVFP